MRLKGLFCTVLSSALMFVQVNMQSVEVIAAETTQYIINDNFDKGTDGNFDRCGWEIGESEADFEAVFPTSHWAMPNMAMVSLPKNGKNQPGKQAIIRKELDSPIDLTKHRVVVETVMSVDTTAGIGVDFGYNKPKSYTEINQDELSANKYTIFQIAANGSKNTDGKPYASVRMLNPSHGMTEAAVQGKAQMVFQESVKVQAILDYNNRLISYYITAPDGTIYTRDGWNDKGNMSIGGDCPTQLKSLDISAWCESGSKFWIDYVKLYTLDPMIETAKVSENTAEFPEGYVAKNNMECVVETDFETKGENDNLTLLYHEAGKTEQKKATVNINGLESGKQTSVRIVADKTKNEAFCYVYQDEKQISNEPVSELDFSAFDIVDGLSAEHELNQVRIYNTKKSVGVKMAKKNGEYRFYLGDKITVFFEAPIVSKKIPDEIKVICGDEEYIPNGSYDEKTGEYVFDMDGQKSGDWQMVLSDDLILGNDGTRSFENNIIDFYYVGSTKPYVENTRLSGKVTEGEIIYASYDYIQAENVAEGKSIHEWYISDVFDGEYSKIDGEDKTTLTVTAQMIGKYIKYAVTPVTEDGAVGEKVFSENIIAPEVCPFATDVKIMGTAAVGATLRLEYTFNDANGDEELGSEYQWYIADSVDGEYSSISNAQKQTYTVQGEDLGKYIKASVVPVSNAEPQRGEMVYSSATVKVGDFIEMTNMVANADFEAGNTSGWTTFNFQTGDGVFLAKAEDGEPALGKYSMLVRGKTEASYIYISPSFTLKGGKTYIAGAKVYPTEETMTKIYAKTNTLTGITLTTPYKEKESIDAKSGRWTSVYTTWVVDGASCSDSRLSMQSDLYTKDFYIDDCYVGELELADICAKCDSQEAIIPEKGTQTVKISDVEVKNQLGTTHGLSEETVSWKMAKEYPGVSIENVTSEGDEAAIVKITDAAVAGVVEIAAVCEPKYAGHTQERFEKSFTITLLPHSDVAPRVDNVKIRGNTKEGETIVGSYDYYQVNGYSDMSEYKWLVSDAEDGTYKEIEGASSLSYTVSAENDGKFIKLSVMPKCENDLSGIVKESNVACAPYAPLARMVTISGEHKIGAKLTADYEFFDVNMDEEGKSIFRWLRADSKDGEYTVISGANTKEYVLGEDDVNKYIKFEVTPVSEKEPKMGESVEGAPFSGPKTPEARNVKITKNGSKLIASYEYYHEFGTAEGKSKYEWIKGSNVISNEISIIADFSGEVTFRVTPIAQEAPYEGAVQTASTTVSKSSGGGGGSSSSSWLNRIPQTTEQTDNIQMNDMQGHWAKSAAEKLVSLGIMKKDSDDSFNPERYAMRAEVIEWFAKTAKIQMADYDNEFEDVRDTDSYSGYLQAMVDEGIISRDVKFRPDAEITREELAKVIYITLNNRGKLYMNNEAKISEFDDEAMIGNWAKGYVEGVLRSGIMIGTSKTEFTPKGKITKAQMAVALSRILDMLGE